MDICDQKKLKVIMRIWNDSEITDSFVHALRSLCIKCVSMVDGWLSLSKYCLPESLCCVFPILLTTRVLYKSLHSILSVMGFIETFQSQHWLLLLHVFTAAGWKREALFRVREEGSDGMNEKQQEMEQRRKCPRRGNNEDSWGFFSILGSC